MFGCHTSAEANPILWHGRIIHWRTPKTTSSQFMTESIHSFSIPNYNRHDVAGRCPCIDTESTQLGVEIIGVFPKLCSYFRLANPDLKSFQNRCDYYRRKSARID